MSNENGFILLNRKMLDWEWYTDANTMRVFIHCLFIANWKDGKFKGVDIPRGCFVSNYAKIASILGISTQNVRTAIAHLKSSGELTSKKVKNIVILRVKNYDTYQSLTGNQQETNTQLTFNQLQINNDRIKEIKSSLINLNNRQTKELVRSVPKLEEVEEYVNSHRLSVNPRKFYFHNEQRGWSINGVPIKNWKLLIEQWEQREKKQVIFEKKLPKYYEEGLNAKSN